MTKIYFQCRMRHELTETVGYIEARAAHVGYRVELNGGQLWEVTHVYQPGVDEKTLREKQNNDRNAFPSIIGHEGKR